MNNNEIKNTLYSLWFNMKAVKKERDENSKNKIRETIRLTFNQLDKLNVAFKIQNQVIALAELNMSFDENINSILGGF